MNTILTAIRWYPLLAALAYRKVGGLHHLRLGRFGLCWYWSRRCQ